MEAHIRELEEIGVARPRTTPMYYRLASTLLTQADTIEVAGYGSSGEAEVVLIHGEDGYWVALGSDHTDRKLETVGVTLSKQVCAKPVSHGCWHFDDLLDHWDEIVLRSTVVVDGEPQLYQEGHLSGLQRPDALLETFLASGGSFPVGSIMFCGTVPVRNGFFFSDAVTLELVDPVLNRTLRHDYAVRALDIVD
ncbi:DUF2848 family protein [Amorphus sp. 3PC139-8]